MTDISSIEATKRRLFLQQSQELATRIEVLRSRAQRGGYDEADLAELASILKSLRYDFAGNDTRLSEVTGLSGKTISQTYSGISRPKYTNFMKMLHGAQQLVEKTIVDGGHRLLVPTDIASRFDGGASGKAAEPIRVPLSGTKSAKSGGARGGELVVVKNRVEIMRYSVAIIAALQEALDYNTERHHNLPRPVLRLEDDEDYLTELRNLVAELRRLNALLERPTRANAKAAQNKASGVGRHFDKFLSSYATTLGKGLAGLTVAGVAGLLYQAGVSSDVINSLWQHLKKY
jgi:hypothetical protein